jgi:hypothetical protein
MVKILRPLLPIAAQKMRYKMIAEYHDGTTVISHLLFYDAMLDRSVGFSHRYKSVDRNFTRAQIMRIFATVIGFPVTCGIIFNVRLRVSCVTKLLARFTHRYRYNIHGFTSHLRTEMQHKFATNFILISIHVSLGVCPMNNVLTQRIMGTNIFVENAIKLKLNS